MFSIWSISQTHTSFPSTNPTTRQPPNPFTISPPIPSSPHTFRTKNQFVINYIHYTFIDTTKTWMLYDQYVVRIQKFVKMFSNDFLWHITMEKCVQFTLLIYWMKYFHLLFSLILWIITINYWLLIYPNFTPCHITQHHIIFL